MKTRIVAPVLVALLWMSVYPAQSQSSDTLKMSLDECVQYALKNSTSIKNSSLDEEIALARVREIRGIGLPQITGSAGLQHYFKLRNLYFPGAAPFAPRNPQTGGLLFPNADQIVNENFFQLPTSVDANVTATQLLFSASYIVGLQAANTYKELMRKSAQRSKEQTASAVKTAYYQQLINTERMKLFDVNLIRLDSSLRQMKAMQNGGFVEQIEVERIEVSYNNLMTEYEKSLNLLVLAALQLKFQMGMPIEQNLALTDNLGKFTADTTFKGDEAFDVKDRTEYQLLQLQVRGNQLNLRNEQGSALPTLVAQGTLGIFTSNNDLNLFKQRSIVTPSGERNQPLFWSDYSFVQVGLNVPIFGGGQRAYRVQQSRLNVKKSENSLKQFEQVANVEVQAAKVNLMNSHRSMKIQKRNMDLARNVNEKVYKKYKAGVVSNLELTNSESALKEAQVNYYNALYDFLINKVEYEQAAGQNKF